MARATSEDVTRLLVQEGAKEFEAAQITSLLTQAGLSPPAMRAWLASPGLAYTILDDSTPGLPWHQVPTHAIEDGHIDRVIDAAREFAAASEDERFISLSLVCDLEQVRRLTHGNEARTAVVVAIARLLLDVVRKRTLVAKVVRTRLSDDYEDLTRLADWMAHHRLDDALTALQSGDLDPQAMLAEGRLFSADW